MVCVERHELDEAHLVGVFAGEARERQDLVLGEAAHRHGVDLDRMGLRELRERVEPAQDLLERVTARHLAEALALERVDRHVEAAHARRDERLGVALELVAVRRQGDLAHVREGAQHRDQARQLAAHERLPAGQADVATPISERTRIRRSISSKLRSSARGEPLHAFRGHAVAAAEAAAIRDREAEIADRPAVTIEQLCAFGDAPTIPIPPLLPSAQAWLAATGG